MDKNFNKRRARGWFIVLAILLVATSAAIFLYTGRGRTPLDEYTAQVNFPLYYPTAMPRGYSLAPDSVKLSGDGLLVYSLRTPSTQSKLVIALQALPSDFDATIFANKDAPPLSVPAGTLYKLSGGEKGKYILTTKEGTLILINTTGKVGSEVINSLAASLQKLD